MFLKNGVHRILRATSERVCILLIVDLAQVGIAVASEFLFNIIQDAADSVQGLAAISDLFGDVIGQDIDQHCVKKNVRER